MKAPVPGSSPSRKGNKERRGRGVEAGGLKEAGGLREEGGMREREGFGGGRELVSHYSHCQVVCPETRHTQKEAFSLE